eukprot:15400848-Alexandrium_andersonii.AAC.1
MPAAASPLAQMSLVPRAHVCEGTKGLADPRSFLVVLGPQIVTELAHSRLVFELAEICVDSLVANERSAVDDCGV